MSDCIIINVNKIIQSDLYDSHLYYLRFLTSKFSIPNLVRPSTADNSNTNRGLTVSVSVSERNLHSFLFFRSFPDKHLPCLFPLYIFSYSCSVLLLCTV